LTGQLADQTEKPENSEEEVLCEISLSSNSIKLNKFQLYSERYTQGSLPVEKPHKFSTPCLIQIDHTPQPI
jgi:hypothetical protein